MKYNEMCQELNNIISNRVTNKTKNRFSELLHGREFTREWLYNIYLTERKQDYQVIRECKQLVTSRIDKSVRERVFRLLRNYRTKITLKETYVWQDDKLGESTALKNSCYHEFIQISRYRKKCSKCGGIRFVDGFGKEVIRLWNKELRLRNGLTDKPKYRHLQHKVRELKPIKVYF